MKKTFSFVLMLTSLTSSLFAQSTNYVNVSRAQHAPLYDCSIYSSYSDRNDCSDLQRDLMRSGVRTSWEDQGYAVDCFDRRIYSEYSRRLCLRLANTVSREPRVLDCDQFRPGSYSENQCQETRRAYRRGEFLPSAPRYNPAPAPMPIPQPMPAPVAAEITPDDRYRDLCGPEAYDRNYQIWQTEKARLEKRAKDRKVGAVLGGLGGLAAGIIIGGRTGEAVGTIAVVGAATLFTLGMVDAADAKFSLPHVSPACRQYFVPEYRMVTIERETCRTTQYTERGWGYSRSYYEVQCSTRTYVTYEQDFAPWQSGRPYRGY